MALREDTVPRPTVTPTCGSSLPQSASPSPTGPHLGLWQTKEVTFELTLREVTGKNETCPIPSRRLCRPRAAFLAYISDVSAVLRVSRSGGWRGR